MNVGDAMMIAIFLIYGGAFLVMAGALWAGIERTAKLGIASHLGILIVFGVTHGLSDLVDAVLRVPGIPADPTGPLAAVRLTLLALSFLALLWFGLSVLIEDRASFRSFVYLGLIASVALAAGLAALFAEEASLGSVQGAERAARLLLGLPGGLLSAVAFGKVAARSRLLGLERCFAGASVAAVGMAAYAVLAGGVATGYPDVVRVLGLPVQMHRMMGAITITAGCMMMLRGLAVSRPTATAEER